MTLAMEMLKGWESWRTCLHYRSERPAVRPFNKFFLEAGVEVCPIFPENAANHERNYSQEVAEGAENFQKPLPLCFLCYLL